MRGIKFTVQDARLCVDAARCCYWIGDRLNYVDLETVRWTGNQDRTFLLQVAAFLDGVDSASLALRPIRGKE